MGNTSVKNKNPFSSTLPTGATRSERKEAGKAARQKVPIESHAKLNIASKGRDIVALLEKSNEGRVAELVPIRYERMLVSPFTFYRGSAALMALDLADSPSSGHIVQSCGDCHIQNFGAFATPERKIILDINDFDETLPAPWEWDVKRLAASLVLAATSNRFPVELGQEAALRLARGYREQIAELSEMSLLERWYSHLEIQSAMSMAQGDTRRRGQRLAREFGSRA